MPSAGAVRAAGVTAMWLAAFVGVGYGAVVGVPKLRAWAATRSMIDPTHLQVAFEPTPSWMPPESLDALRVQVRDALQGTSALDAANLAFVHQRLATSGWFSRVEQVKRRSATEIVVSGEFLVPFALVRSGDEDHVVDARSRRLPLSYATTGRRPQLPLVTGVAMPRPAEMGAAWIGQDVRASLKLASLIRTHSWFGAGQVVAIDASRFNTDSILELVTDRGTRVVWGSDPDARALGEMPTDRKLACLDALYAGTQRIDDPTGRGVDLRFDVVTLGPTESTLSVAEAPTDRSGTRQSR